MASLKKWMLAIAVGGPLFLAAGAGHAAPFANGGFEVGSDPGSYTTLAAGSTAIAGWTVTPVSIDYIGTLWQAADGVRSVDLSGAREGEFNRRSTPTPATIIWCNSILRATRTDRPPTRIFG